MAHGSDATDYDVANWEAINAKRHAIAKDSLAEKGLLTRVKEALDSGEYELASSLQKDLQREMSELRKLYIKYRKNLF